MRDQTSSMSNHVLAETLGSPGQSTTGFLEHGVAGFTVSEFLAQVVDGMLFSLCLVLLSKDTTMESSKTVKYIIRGLPSTGGDKMGGSSRYSLMLSNAF